MWQISALLALALLAAAPAHASSKPLTTVTIPDAVVPAPTPPKPGRVFTPCRETRIRDQYGNVRTVWRCR